MEEITAGGRTVTLKDLASELGIHPSTVSRILHSGSEVARGAASVATAERVRELARKRGYSPDPQAAGLRTRRTHLMGVIVPRLSDLVLAIMYEGIDEAAAELGYSTFVMNSRDEPEEQRRKTDSMLARRVDGLIIGDAHLDSGLLRELAARKVPFVLMNRRVPGFPSATCDDVLGGELVADHLWSKGHRDVAVIAGEPYASTAVDRTAGFVDRWRALGGKIPRERRGVVPVRYRPEDGKRPRPSWLTAIPPDCTVRRQRLRGHRRHGSPAVPWPQRRPATWRWLASMTPPWPRNFPSRSLRSARPCWISGGRRCSSSRASWTAGRSNPVRLKPVLCVRESSAFGTAV